MQLRRLLAEILGSTWAAMEGLSGVIAYVRGTSAGTSLADLIFTVAFAQLLKQTRRRMDKEGLTFEI